MAIKYSKNSWTTLAIYAGLVLGSGVATLPFIWMVLASFMTRGETMRRVLWPDSIQWSNYLQAWTEADFGLYFENSLIIASLQVAGTLLFSLMAAYPLARMSFKGRDVVFVCILATLMVPETVTMVPNFLTVTWLHRQSPKYKSTLTTHQIVLNLCKRTMIGSVACDVSVLVFRENSPPLVQCSTHQLTTRRNIKGKRDLSVPKK